MKWTIELGQFDVHFKSRTTIKGQALVDFLAEFSYQPDDVESQLKEKSVWRLFIDGSSNENVAGASVILVSLEQHRIHHAMRFGFKASNNKAEYEAFITRLQLTKELKACYVHVFSDS